MNYTRTNPIEGKTPIDLSPLQTIQSKEFLIHNLYDIYFNKQYEGWKRKEEKPLENGSAQSTVIEQHENEQLDLLIFNFQRRKESESESPEQEYIPIEYPIALLDKICIPLKKGEGEEVIDKSFELDSIVCIIPGHYYCYVKCMITGEWLKYGADAGGLISEQNTYKDFNQLLEREKTIQNEACILFYSKL